MKELFFILAIVWPFLSSAANNFSGDPNVKALYNFESDDLTKDSISTNTLTNAYRRVTANTSNYRQGAASASFVEAKRPCLFINDANLASGFPLKFGDKKKVISVSQWIYLNSFPPLPPEPNMMALSAKWDDTDHGGVMTGLTFKAAVHQVPNPNRTTVQLCLGWKGGSKFEKHSHGANLSLHTWYHVTASYGGDATKAYAVRIRGINGNVVGTDLTGTATLDANGLSVTSRDWGMGCQPNPTWNTLVQYCFNGLLDEQVYFNKFLSATDATNLAKGTYSGGGDISRRLLPTPKKL